MDMTQTASYLQKAFDAGAGRVTPSAIVNEAVKLLPAYGFSTLVIAELIAQTAHETGGYVRFVENLNYKAAALTSQWPTHFTQAQAAAAVGNPVEIASRAYGGRMGNAPYPSKDGYIYRGRGMLQLTGKQAYTNYADYLELPLVTSPDLAADPAISFEIACEYFKRNGLPAVINAGDFVKARKLVNGGTIGLDDVAARRAKVLGVLK